MTMMLTTTSTNSDWTRQDLAFLAGLSSDRSFSETDTEYDVPQFVEQRTLPREVEFCLPLSIAVGQSLEASTADVGLIWQRHLLDNVVSQFQCMKHWTKLQYGPIWSESSR